MPIRGSLHVRTLDAGGAPDEQVWALAQQHGCVLVTKDEDFHHSSILRGAPPHVIWIRLGNCSTQEIEDLPRTHRDALRRLTESDEATFVAGRTLASWTVS